MSEYDTMYREPQMPKYEPGFVKSVENLPHPLRTIKVLHKEHPDIMDDKQFLTKVEPGGFHKHRMTFVESFRETPPNIAASDLLYALRTSPKIFDIAKDLGDLLRKTDIKGAEFDMLHLPFPSIYIQLPPSEFKVHSHIEGEGMPLEGIYLLEEDLGAAEMGEMIRLNNIPLSLVSNEDMANGVAQFLGKRFKLLLMIAVGRKDGLDDCVSSMPIYFKDSAGLEEQLDARVEDLKKRKMGQERENLLVVEDVFKWVMNCLLYINCADSDVRKEWLHKGLAEKVKQATGPKKTKLRHQLQETSAEIHYVGRSIRIGTPPAVSPGEPGGEKRRMSLHWVRGFWRNQACGPQFSEHKHIWIRPFLRGEGAEIVGKIYEAK